MDTIREPLLDKLKRAGINWLALGIESGNDRVLNDVDKAYSSEKLFKTIELIKKYGLYTIGNYIFGLPEDDHQAMQDTLDLALTLNCEFPNFYSAMAYPGSKLYKIAIEQGWPLPENWNGFSQHAENTLPLPTRHLAGGEVLRFRDKAFQKYFFSPDYLSLINRKFGAATVEEIKKMASFILKRNNC